MLRLIRSGRRDLAVALLGALLRELLVFDYIVAWYRRIARRTAGLRRRQLDHAKITGLQTAATDGLVAATTVGVLVAVVGAHAAGAIPLTSATMAVILVIAAFAPVTAAIGMAGPLAPLRTSARRVLDVLAQPAQVPDTATSAPAIGSAGVRFESVTFGYPGGAPVLRNVDLDMPAHEMVALVGHSGAGKSTCVNLLLRFWDTDSGRSTSGVTTAGWPGGISPPGSHGTVYVEIDINGCMSSC